MGILTHKAHGLGKAELEFLYCKMGLSDAEIGQRFGLSDVGVGYLRRKHGISTMSSEDRISLRARNGGLKDVSAMTDNDWQELYSRFGLSKMGEMFGCSKVLMKRKVADAGVQIISKHQRHEFQYPDILTQEQIEVLEGSLLGDGMLVRQRETVKFSECHCLAQKDYLEWKRRVFLPFSGEMCDADKLLDDGRTAKGVKFYTCYHSIFSPYETLFYGDNREKRLPVGLMERMSPLSLAVWYMDDGHWNGWEYTLASSFCESDIEMVIGVLNGRFGLDIIRRSGSGVFILVFQNKERFFEIVSPHIHSVMAYKFPLIKRFLLPCVNRPDLKGFDTKESGTKWNTVDEIGKESFLNQCVDYWGVAGFPYPKCGTKERRKELKALCETKIVLDDMIPGGGLVGSRVCQSFFKDFWAARKNGKRSPLEVFSNRDLLRDALRDCLEHRGSATEGNLRAELQTWGGVHNFRPALAKAIYDKYCSAGDKVLDPCAGWGGRLLGFFCSPHPLEYVGVDASSETAKGLKHLSLIVNRDFPSKSVKIHYGAFENWKPESVFDLVFTSPPYFCKEIYSQDLMQSSARYGDYDSWRERFLVPLIEKSFSVLRKDGIFILNIANVKIGRDSFPVADDAEVFLRKFGSFVTRHDLATKNMYTGENKIEPMFVFKKGV